MEDKITKIIRNHFDYADDIDIVNVNKIYRDIYAYKIVYATQPTAFDVDYGVIRINSNYMVIELPELYRTPIENLLNAFDNKEHTYQKLEDKYQILDKENKKLEKKIDFLNDRIKKIQNKQKISSLIFDYLDLDELSREKFNEVIKKMSNLNKSSDLPY